MKLYASVENLGLISNSIYSGLLGGVFFKFIYSCTYVNTIDLSRKKQLFDLEVKGQGSTKVIMVCDTPPYGHAPTHQISLTYLERQKCYGPDNKILFKTRGSAEPVSLT